MQNPKCGGVLQAEVVKGSVLMQYFHFLPTPRLPPPTSPTHASTQQLTYLLDHSFALSLIDVLTTYEVLAKQATGDPFPSFTIGI